jgi:hypothetical protein
MVSRLLDYGSKLRVDLLGKILFLPHKADGCAPANQSIASNLHFIFHL